MTQNRSLLIVTHYYAPELGAPARRLEELARALVDAGWSVSVVTALPNYPDGRRYAGHGRWMPRRTNEHGVAVLRVPVVPLGTSLVRRLLNYASFAASGIVGGVCSGAQDVVYVESPPPTTFLVGHALRRLRAKRLVLNVSDLWPRSAVELGILSNGRIASALDRFVTASYRLADGMTGQSEEIVKELEELGRPTPTALVLNGVDVSRFPSSLLEAAAQARRTRADIQVVYLGLLGFAQGLDQVLDAAVRLEGAGARISIVIGGAGPEETRLRARCVAEGIRNVTFLGRVAGSDVPAVLANADVALVPLARVLSGAVPSKLYEAMAAALPIVLVGGGEAAKRVTEVGCGLVVEPGNVDALVDRLCRLARDPQLRVEMGTQGRRAAEEQYDRARAAQNLDRFLRSITPA